VTQPFIILVFANDQDAYLPKLVAEEKAIQEALVDYADKNYLEVRQKQHTSTEEVFYLINRYHNKVRIFHYGGHANGTALQLEKEIGIVQMANVKGIAGLLGTQKHLKLVFLNGCASKGQVKALLESGVPAVIATSAAIQDTQAQRFASIFYEALGKGSSIKDSFIKAKALLETEENAPHISNIEETRGLVLKDQKQDTLPWGLYFLKDNESTLDWVLPAESFYNIEFGANNVGTKRHPVANSILATMDTLKAIKDSKPVKELVDKIKEIRKEGDTKRNPTDAEKKGAILKAFPTPISIHLQELFSETLSHKLNKPRLIKLVTTYQKVMKLISFILLSDIWDCLSDKKMPFKLEEEEKRHLSSFFNLNEQLAPYYNYFLLADNLLKIAHRHKIELHIPAFNDYPNGWVSLHNFNEAEDYFQMLATAIEDNIPSQLIESFCLTGEQYLTNVLCELSFLTSYKMAVIKDIGVLQIKNLPPTKYKHTLVEMEMLVNKDGTRDRPRTLKEPTDMKSILLYHQANSSFNAYLNLSPFILDENALTGAINTKTYLYSYQCKEGLVFELVENSSDTLVIKNNEYDFIHQQFEKAKERFLEKKIRAAEPIEETDDISALL